MQNRTSSGLRQKMFTHIEHCAQSDLTQKDYCRKYGIKVHVFYYWLRKYREEKSVTDGFIAIEPAIPFAGNIHIRYPNGVELQLPAETTIPTLHALITAI